MFKTVLFGFRRRIFRIPERLFRHVAPREARRIKKWVGSLPEDHRRVHHFVVKTIPKTGEPVSPQVVAEAVDLPVDEVTKILDYLESRLVYLFRDGGESVVWAYPVTAEPTPHQVRFDTGERVFAA